SLALVWGSGQQQQVGRSFGQSGAQLVAGDLVGTATHAVGLINDHQIPAGGNQIFESFAVVAVELLQTPATAALNGFDRVQRHNHLVVHCPEVVVILGALSAPGAKGCQLGGFDKAQVLAKMQ